MAKRTVFTIPKGFRIPEVTEEYRVRKTLYRLTSTTVAERAVSLFQQSVVLQFFTQDNFQTYLLFDKKTNQISVGVSKRTPTDVDNPTVGQTISLTRAVREWWCYRCKDITV